MIRTRIAPSPTGNLHIGTARTALFNYLFAKKMGGKFVVRIEDTDIERSDKKFEKNIFEGLKWLGIEEDEGPTTGGSFGPYRQSERIDTYRPYLEKLLAQSKAFYCFHSEKELAEEKENLMKNKIPPIHLCEYRNMPLEEANILKEAKGGDYVIRFKIPTTPSNHQITFQDDIRGQVHFFTRLLGDFSIAKDVNTPLYNFAVVIDDHEMEITHVIRGEDHISNTPKQLLIAQAFGWAHIQSPPGDLKAKWNYAHLPLILGPDRSKLSKRHGATSVDEYRELGYLPEALFNFMTLLGWNPGDDREILSKDELIKLFSMGKVQKSGAIFDLNKLNWMNGEYLRKKSIDELGKLSKPFLKDFRQNTKQKTKKYLEKILELEQPRIKKLSELPEKVDYFFKEPAVSKDLLRWKNMTDEEIKSSIKKSIELLKENKETDIKNVEKLFLEEAEKMGDRGQLLWPLRATLSGKKASAGPFEIMSILGIEKSIERLEKALKDI